MILLLVIFVWVCCSIAVHLTFEEMQRWWIETSNYYIPGFDEDYGKLRAIYVLLAPIPIALSAVAFTLTVLQTVTLMLWLLCHWLAEFFIQTFIRDDPT